MRTPRRRLLKVLALATGVFVGGTAFGATYTLRAAATTLALPDGVTTVPLWGYALVSYDLGAGPVSGDNVVTVPGPRLTVPAGQGLTVNIVNELAEPVSIVIPGQLPPLAAGATSPQVMRNPDGRVRSFTHETPAAVLGVAGPAVSYTWAAIAPGTYLYHSGTHPAKQVQMGLYGAATSNAVEAGPGTPAEAYAGLPYDAEALIIYSEIDPALHAAVAGGIYGTPLYPSTLDYRPTLFLVNGAVGDSPAPAASVAPASRLLLRFVNAGLKEHAPQVLGSHVSAVAEDGKKYGFARQQVGLLLAAGKSLDAIMVPGAAGTFKIFDGRFYRSNVPTVQGASYAFVSVGP
jgi:FtsP/CotA-like multicopper oxidase with cupredoxin domain